MQREAGMPYSIGSVCPGCGNSIAKLERCPKCYRRPDESEAPERKPDTPVGKKP
jgi:predicted amidophosphoribosyltransferase